MAGPQGVEQQLADDLRTEGRLHLSRCSNLLEDAICDVRRAAAHLFAAVMGLPPREHGDQLAGGSLSGRLAFTDGYRVNAARGRRH
ncbi:MAG TPA: hypothetical protein VFJ19_18870 [Nocardioidaceae bacterium]|nr:hypothetical protein [Nocardioidaceae bacterium]